MKAFSSNAHFSAHIKPGKQAIKNEHRDRFVETPAVTVKASLNFDAATPRELKQHKQWDYFIEVSHQADTMHAVEVHAFEASALISKREGTRQILRARCPEAADAIRSWNVILRGETRSDILNRFSAETKIKFHRNLLLSKLPNP